jgi:hypothetical protein
MFEIQTWIETDSRGIVGIFRNQNHLVLVHYDGKIELRLLENIKKQGQYLPRSIQYLYGVNLQGNTLYRAPEEGGVEAWTIGDDLEQFSLSSLIKQPHMITSSENHVILKGDTGIEVIDRRDHTSQGMLYEKSSKDRHRDFPLALHNHFLLESPNHNQVKIWNIKTFELEADLPSEIQYISGCNWMKDKVGIATESCIENGDPCEVLLWNYQEKTIQKLPITMNEEFYRELQISPSLQNKKGNDWLLATGFAWIDIWEWETWKQIAHIETINDANATCLDKDTLYVGNMDGVLSIFKYQR